MRTYSINLMWSDEDAGYIATTPEFENLSAFGDTAAEALSEAEAAIEGYVRAYKSQDKPLPPPLKRTHYSGQIRLRMPKSLHGKLSEMAGVEGVSLNTLILTLIAESYAYRKVQLSSVALASSWFAAVANGSGQVVLGGAQAPLDTVNEVAVTSADYREPAFVRKG